MQNTFGRHLNENFPFLKGKKILVAVSGGVDSVVLTHLCKSEDLDFSIAHCNFHLRGKESNADESFVKKLAKKLEVPVFIEYFETEEYASKNKLSIQMAARELRYKWFQKLSRELGFSYILTAHHANDSLETFLINTLRGTGLEGLTGIPAKNENIIRPLLGFSRKQIEDFAQANTISWREDSSNRSDKYLRNKIRHKIIPVLEEENPDLPESFLKTQGHLQSASNLLQEYSEILSQEITEEKEGRLYFNIQKIRQKKHPKAVLYQLLRDYGFTEWENVHGLLSAQSGKMVLSPTHRLVKDRNHLILTRIEPKDFQEIEITKFIDEVRFPLGKLHFEKVGKFQKPGKNEVYVDAGALKFPLKLRKWKQGDWFYPFGMGHRKKISSFLKDEKFSLPEKEKTWVLLSEGQILWVIGHRADNRFKITSKTRKMVRIVFSVNIQYLT